MIKPTAAVLLLATAACGPRMADDGVHTITGSYLREEPWHAGYRAGYGAGLRAAQMDESIRRVDCLLDSITCMVRHDTATLDDIIRRGKP